MSSSSRPTFEELRDCVEDVIKYLRHINIPNIGSTKVCVIGGLAMWNYLRSYRATTVKAPLPAPNYLWSFLRRLLCFINPGCRLLDQLRQGTEVGEGKVDSNS